MAVQRTQGWRKFAASLPPDAGDGKGEIDVLLISPERLNNRRFRQNMLPALV